MAICASLRPAGADAQECNRTCLENWVDTYLNAVVDNDPSAVRLSRDVRFTENGQRLEIGDGLWRSMKAKGNYRLFVTDVPAQQVTLLTTIEEDDRDPAGAVPALMALRLKIDDNRISEIEQMVVRSPDAARRVEAMGAPHPMYLETIPRSRRMSRRDLIETANKYFTGMQQNDGRGDYPFTDDCHRVENGSGATNQPTPPGQTRPDPATATGYSGQWGCREQFESGLLYFVTRIRDRRFVAVDEERGLVFSFVFFDHSAGETRTFETPNGRTITAGPAQPWTWGIAELFKIEDEQIRQIEAILHQVPYGMLSGWSSWEDGMSDDIQDVTGI
ncbi:MAG: hypothetical protein R3305_01680 [Gammaproteobacteria bacterium]|nr:hypothetical protein [Gammaproteobacteria bacterium]